VNLQGIFTADAANEGPSPRGEAGSVLRDLSLIEHSKIDVRLVSFGMVHAYFRVFKQLSADSNSVTA